MMMTMMMQAFFNTGLRPASSMKQAQIYCTRLCGEEEED
jgi:hypothetical protein